MRSSSKRTVEPRHVPALVDHPASPHLADLVDAVGELIPTVLDGDLGIGSRQVAAVDVGDARHELLIDPERLELAMER